MSLYLGINESFGGVTGLHRKEGQKQKQWSQKKRRRGKKKQKQNW